MKTNKKISIFPIIMLCLVFGTGFYACDDRDELFGKEQYENVLCLLSNDDLIFSVDHSLDEAETTGHFSIIIGGSKFIQEDVTLEFELDPDLLNEYNKRNFDIDTEKYAQLLDPKRYTIPSFSLTIKGGIEEQYDLLPIKVNTAGLSPDTTYMVPLRIKNVSNYRVNTDKQRVMYRVRTYNDYATQSPLTYYTSRGSVQGESQADPMSFNLTKLTYPMTKNQIRFYPGNLQFDPKTASVGDINKNAALLQVNADKTITFIPHGTVQIEKLSGSASDNIYEELEFNDEIRRSFYLYYRYRTMNGEGEYGEWINVKETLQRIE